MLAWLRRLVLLGLLIGVGVAGYVMPRSTGDRFAAALVRLDIKEASMLLCPETSLAQIGSHLGAESGLGTWLAEQLRTGLSVPGWTDLAQTMRLESNYNPLSSVYSVSYAIDQTITFGGLVLQGGVKTPPLALTLRRLGLFSVCVAAL